MTDFKKVKNIIFDLGAVIINIDFSKTFKAFASLSNLSEQEVAERYHNAAFFLEFEKGAIGNAVFIEKVRAVFGLPANISDEQIVFSWNSLLLNFPIERIKRIQKLSSCYRLFLLSNTNPIHISEINNILYKEAGIHRLEELFEKTWYSYDLGLVKPHRSIYEKVMANKSLLAEETIFLDDNEDNIMGARQARLTAFHVHSDMDLIELLKNA